jgi:hypothetical protein
MMRRRAGFQANQARRNPGKKRKDLAASQPLTHHHATCRVDRMNLEDIFCEIETNCCNVTHGWLPLLVIFDDHHLGTSMPSGGHPPHQLAASSEARRIGANIAKLPELLRKSE